MTGTISVREPSFFSTSTARPRLTAPSSDRDAACRRSARSGRPSPAARRRPCAIANAIRCVNETFAPASFSWRRRASSSPTAIVRRLVAVGIDAALLHVVNEHRRAAAQLGRGLRGGRAVGLGGAVLGGREHVLLDDPARRARCPRARRARRAARRRRGARPARRGRRPRRVRQWPVGDGAVDALERRPAAGPSAVAPAAALVMRPITWPTVTVSPARDEQLGDRARRRRRQLDVHLVGGDLDDRVAAPPPSPRPSTVQSRIVPSVTDSPAAGVTMSIVVALAAGAAAARAGADRSRWRMAQRRSSQACRTRRAARSPAESPLGAISASSAPTATVSPAAAWILTTVPATGAATSASTLSVEISTIVSSAVT